MSILNVIGTAFANALRSKLRTFLTVIAIVIGAFTLALTTGLAAGINTYVDRVESSFGDPDQMFVLSTASTEGADTVEGPVEYDPDDTGAAAGADFGGGPVITVEDVEFIEGIDHVESVDPVFFTDTDYLEAPDGIQYTLSLDIAANSVALELAAGELPEREANELTVPDSWVEALGGSSAEDLIGESVTIGLTSTIGEERQVEATISGVSEEALSGVGGEPLPSFGLAEAIFDEQMAGYAGEVPDSYSMVAINVDDVEANETSIKNALLEEDLMGLTLEDQVGVLRDIINIIAWVLGGFAIIALLAASFGIVNTLLMSVQERTREIGLMKALGMSSGKIFGLFSTEAVVIGVMGSLIGIGAGLGLGSGLNAWLTGDDGPFGDVVGLTLFGISPVAVIGIFALIVVIAFIAGTLPAARAAKKDPIEALRYE